MMVADDLAPERCQVISNHHDDNLINKDNEWNNAQSDVIMMVADDLAPKRFQVISNHHDGDLMNKDNT